MSAWPASVWRSSWLAGIDVAGRDALQASGTLRALERGEALFEPGEPADGIFVVDEGVVEVLAVRRGEAEASAVRRAVAGDAVGEEAVVRSGFARVTGARCATRARVVGIPVGVYRRVRERAGGPSSAAARAGWERELLEGAAQDALCASSLSRVLDARQLKVAAKGASHRQLSRGEALFSQGDPRGDVLVVADGMVSLETEDDGRTRIQAYLRAGDLVDDGAVGAAPRAMTARACGPAWVIALPRETLAAAERSRPDVLARLRRVTIAAPTVSGTRHVQGDLWRYAVAGSLLVIDDEACVRCGHCAWSCADSHADGVSRLVRRGEKLQVRDATDGSQRALIVPGSCQHCKNPACMIDCPTGAIGRGAHGQVLIREDICVGCGQCERACPWGGVQMAPRLATLTALASTTLSAQVAVKCDLCSDRDAGPACVNACPVEAIARVEPLAAMADVREAVAERVPRTALPRARRAWPWVLGATIVAAAVARLATRGGPSLASGVVAGTFVALLVAYSGLKRSPLTRLRWLPGARANAVAHLALGIATAGVVVAHASTRIPPNAAGAALLAFALASATGVLTGVAYAVLPGRLARVERRARLPEDLRGRARELEERTFGALTGRSAASKALYAQVLAPYAAAPLGGVALIVSGRSLQDEEARVRARIDSVVEGRRLDGLADLVRLVVEGRAIRAQRLLQGLLRVCVPVHVVSVAIALVLVAVHVMTVVGRR
jgi:Fe-S-cluster-containing dehydrogenase component/CRP-like cAMP-binding protein